MQASTYNIFCTCRSWSRERRCSCPTGARQTPHNIDTPPNFFTGLWLTVLMHVHALWCGIRRDTAASAHAAHLAMCSPDDLADTRSSDATSAAQAYMQQCHASAGCGMQVWAGSACGRSPPGGPEKRKKRHLGSVPAPLGPWQHQVRLHEQFERFLVRRLFQDCHMHDPMPMKVWRELHWSAPEH